MGIFLGEGYALHLVFHLVAEDVIALGDLVSARHNGNSIRNLRKCEDALADADDDKLREKKRKNIKELSKTVE